MLCDSQKFPVYRICKLEGTITEKSLQNMIEFNKELTPIPTFSEYMNQISHERAHLNAREIVRMNVAIVRLFVKFTLFLCEKNIYSSFVGNK